MQIDLQHFAFSAWLITGIYWLILSFTSKRVSRREPWHSRFMHLTVAATAFWLLAGAGPAACVLTGRFLPDEDWVGFTGAVLTILGCALAIWARTCLGANWSAVVSVRQEHELIRRGPYSLMRHPIYSGFLLAALGTAISNGEYRGLLAIYLLFVALLAKACAEEQAMFEQFGAEYLQYSMRVKRFVPFVL
jgi:protein-S-isoprenylcysteine O-methyltransferase Ste14